MSKVKLKVSRFHWIHLIAMFVLGGYFIASKVNLVSALSNGNLVASFFQLYFFGIIFACLFLFVFSHERFFTFAHEIEKQEARQEKKYLSRYVHHGKVFGTFLIGAIGGPVFSSLTARLLINNLSSKYLIVMLANIPSTLFTLGLGHGIVQVIF